MVWLEVLEGLKSAITISSLLGSDNNLLLVPGLEAGLILSWKSIPIKQLLNPTCTGEPN